MMSVYGFSGGCKSGKRAWTFGENYRRAAESFVKFLKGVKPGDLPVERPTKFDLVLNMKTAKALKLEISRELQLRVDRVIE